MRDKIIAGNWKMNCNRQEAQSLTAEIVAMMQDEVKHDHKVVLAPPFPFTGMLVQQCAGEKRISVAAQNCSDKSSGAFTGEVSAAMLNSIGVSYIIAGHSERRTIFHETDEVIAEKVKQTLEAGCIPIFCCGETQSERNGNKHFDTVRMQLSKGLFHLGLQSITKVVIAYEPVWAIGTGVTATPAQAQEMHAFIRNKLQSKYGSEVSSAVSILYGGSCNEQNAAELFSLKDVDGGLIGGASLKSRSFVNIIKAMK